MQRKLIEFLQGEAGRPFWGVSDCCLVIANWWFCVHGVDPAAWLRGTYSTAAEKDAVVAQHRSLQRLVTRIASDAGAVRTRTPNIGDFGLIAVGGKPYGAICTGRVSGRTCWAVRSETGVTFLTSPRLLRAWSIHARLVEVGPHLEGATDSA